MITVLVDLSNTTVHRGVYRPNRAIIGGRLDLLVRRTAELIVAGRGSFQELTFRLYDGWYDETGTGTDLYGMLRSHLREDYPTRQRNFRVFVEIAEALAASPEDRLAETSREQRGIDRYPVSVESITPATCSNPTSCSVSVLRGWLKGACPHLSGCSVRSKDIASFRYQKLVDTSLVADAVWLATRRQSIAIVSDDEDVIPGLLTARSLGSDVTWVGTTAKPRPPYMDILVKHGVGYIQC